MKFILPTVKIVLFAEYNCTGGARTYVKQLLAFYKELGADVYIVAAKNCSHHDEEMDLMISSYGFSIVNVHTRLPGFYQKEGIRYFAELLQYYKLLRAIAPDIAVASVASPGLFVGAIRGAKRSIYVLHSLLTHNSRLTGWRNKLRKLSFRLLFNRNHRILTVSDFSKRELANEWGIGSPAIVTRLHNTAGCVIPLVPIRTDGLIVVLTLGHVRDYKNPFLWISVARLVIERLGKSEIVFQWLGEGELLADCVSQVSGIGLNDNIQFLGHQDDIEYFYRTCSLYFQPSLVENCCLSVLDAMRHGRACITTNVGGLPELVHDSVSGFLIDPVDIEEMAEKIIQLARDPELRMAMGRNGWQIYGAEFSHDAWEAELMRCHL